MLLLDSFTGPREAAAVSASASAVYGRRPAEADRLLERELLLDPLNTTLRSAHASAALFAGDTAEAVRRWEVVLRVDPLSAQALVSSAYLGDAAPGDGDRRWQRLRERLPELHEHWTRHRGDPLRASGDAPEWDGRGALVVLGAGLAPDGSPRPLLRARVDAALRLDAATPADRIIVTGGNAQAGRTEADVMRALLVDGGVDPARITIDGRSTDTIENAFAVIGLAAEAGIGRLHVVTSPFHVPRARAVFDTVDEVRGSIGSGARSSISWAMIGPPVEAVEAEETRTRRDVLRAHGFWAFPGYER
ncbi:YdcF family protein [Rathayibacter sp. VKM Ac-2760]|uniref:YdcF family protein n=1 Tax=Rathayibacter sp. VKM Ac-2760 TaxID=2609253 RepID=UPI001317DBBF|nr:YdcF family protein [Rathayibacter sp. VKM Ac-2760]QHC59579.1 hypothetical protein GSU72_14215 [Rathayibacter sp. VKM Ac-2760]